MKRTFAHALILSHSSDGDLSGESHHGGSKVQGSMARFALLQDPQPFLHLVREAEIYPNNVALVSPERRLTYQELATQSARLAKVFARRGIKKNDFVNVSAAPDLQVIIGFALFALAAIGGSYPELVTADCSVPFDWLIGHDLQDGIAEERTIFIDHQLMEEAGTITDPLHLERYDDFGSTCRLIFSSGTTGKPLAVPYSVAITQNYAQAYSTCWTETQPFMNFVHFGSAVGYYDAFAAFASGATYFCPGTPAQNVRTIEENFIGSCMASPLQLASLLEAAQHRPGALKELSMIYTVGSTIAPNLARSLVDATGCKLGSAFGTTENAALLRGWFDAEGTVPFYETLPIDVEIEFVDEQGRVVPEGSIGEMRIRTPHMPENYLFAPSTNSSFRDGWFYSGDLGSFTSESTVELVGRSSDVVNIGGVKINLVDVDNQLIELPGIVDVATFDYVDAAGVPCIGVALVTGESFEKTRFTETFAISTRGLDPSHVMELDDIPRNQMDKPLRRELAELMKGTE